MDWTTLIFCLFLVAVSAVLTSTHVRAWRRERNEEDEERAYGYARRKFRRRMQASIMIGIAGVAILVGQALPALPMLLTVYWLGIVFLVVWIALLALADILDTRNFLTDLRQDQLLMHAKLKEELSTRRNEQGGEQSDSFSDKA